MGQDWAILNLDKKQVINNGGKLGEFIECVGKNLYCVVCQPTWIPVTKIMESMNINYKKDYDPRSLGLIGKLPVEIIGKIISEVDNLKCMIYLACTNTRLMILGEKHLCKLMHCPSWEGDRIICLGNYARNDDLPEGVLSQEYLDFIKKSEESEEPCEEAGWSFVDWARSTFKRGPLQNLVLKGISRGLDTSDLYKNFTNRFRIPENARKEVGVIRDFIWKLTDDDRVFVEDLEVLWNHTKKIYLRYSTAIDKFEKSGVYIDDGYNLLGTLLLIHICWSSDSSTSMGYTGEALHRGSWAGDRFEFTGAHVLGPRLEQEKGEWKDVSKDAIKFFEDVFEADLGENWRKKIFH